MTNDGIPSDLGSAGRRPVRASRSTPDLSVELQEWVRALSVAAIAVVDRNVTRLETLRIPFLTLLRLHVERIPDNPRWN